MSNSYTIHVYNVLSRQDVCTYINESSLAGAPRNTGLAEALRNTGLAEAPKNIGLAEAPKNTGLAEAPKNTGLAEAPKCTGLTEAPKSTGLAEAPKSTGLAEVTKRAGGQQNRTGETPESRVWLNDAGHGSKGGTPVRNSLEDGADVAKGGTAEALAGGNNVAMTNERKERAKRRKKSTLRGGCVSRQLQVNATGCKLRMRSKSRAARATGNHMNAGGSPFGTPFNCVKFHIN